MKADLCVLDVTGPSWSPMTNPLFNAVFAGHGADVVLTVIRRRRGVSRRRMARRRRRTCQGRSGGPAPGASSPRCDAGSFARPNRWQGGRPCLSGRGALSDRVRTRPPSARGLCGRTRALFASRVHAGRGMRAQGAVTGFGAWPRGRPWPRRWPWPRRRAVAVS